MARRPAIIPASAEHIAHIVANMRAGDLVELAAIGRTPQSSLTAALRLSREAWTGMIDGVPVCMFGVAPTSMLTPWKGRPWMLGTTALDDNAILFLRRCRPVVARMLEAFPQLENFVAASNVRAIEWLRWLGFEIHETPIDIGLKKVPFHKFTMERAPL